MTWRSPLPPSSNVRRTATAQVAVFDRARRWRVFLQADNANPHNLESVGNETIGVLGVSGSSSEGDEKCVMAGIATVADQLR